MEQPNEMGLFGVVNFRVRLYGFKILKKHYSGSLISKRVSLLVLFGGRKENTHHFLSDRWESTEGKSFWN